ncbi:protein kinase domain-containing protein [Endozoicomonas numazuensis]|uniref:Protein kinase domain-containing protein n=1 Tax=Endozoicomonas numazuensis TaxID=1137799 RepID=A0A081NFK5_9GAMM|nr:protein kinase [Endozoicomonas numazuensis]KEQ17228.1 hypothetical protein GZ78_15465 [Endozoicomonas numazuensis]
MQPSTSRDLKAIEAPLVPPTPVAGAKRSRSFDKDVLACEEVLPKTPSPEPDSALKPPSSKVRKASNTDQPGTIRHCPFKPEQGWGHHIDAACSEEALDKLLSISTPLKTLGSGHMGKVKLMKTPANKRYAVKFIEPPKEASATHKPDRRGLIQGEITALSRPSHANVADTYALLVRNIRSGHYCVINSADQIPDDQKGNYEIRACIGERVAGKDLQKAWAGGRSTHLAIGAKNAIQVGHQVCQGLKHLHDHKILYRDLKPENIMCSVSDTGQITVKLIDFGLNKTLEPGSTTRSFCGTPSYFAPEILVDDREVRQYNLQVDAWTLGIVLLEASCGYLPANNNGRWKNKEILDRKEQFENIKEFADFSAFEKKAALNKYYPEFFEKNQPLLELIANLTEETPSTRMTIEDAVPQLAALAAQQQSSTVKRIRRPKSHTRRRPRIKKK